MRTAICMNVRNEEHDIAEWMAFHAEAGFGTQIIFDNASTDATADMVRAASHLWDVRYHNWSQNDHKYQVDAYYTACHIYRHDFDWIAFIDSDEYFVTAALQPVGEFLAPFGLFGAVGVNWAIYGSNGHRTRPDGLLTQAFIRRSEAGFFPNRHIKSVVQPKMVLACENPHWFVVEGGYCDTSGQALQWFEDASGVQRGLSARVPDYSACRVNHYFTRSRAQWAAKVQRGYPANIAVRQLEEFAEYDRNEVLDPVASRHAAAVRRRVELIRDAAGHAA